MTQIRLSLKTPPKTKYSTRSESSQTLQRRAPLRSLRVSLSLMNFGYYFSTSFVVGKASYKIQYFALPVLTWPELISYTNNANSDPLKLSELSNSKSGLLVVDLRSSLGRGAMKTCNPGCLMFNEPGSGTEHVALKRPYTPGTYPKQILRYVVQAELTDVVSEGVTLVWATSLFGLARSYIRASELSQNIPYHLPLFPDLRFVNGGLALILGAPNQPGVQKTTSTFTTTSTSAGSYLVEERVDMLRSSPWIKLINNSHPTPTAAVRPNSPEMALATFLLFIQHLQWKLTHGLAFVSDFQG